MKKITMDMLVENQKAAEKLRQRNRNRVELWYNANSGTFELCELIGQDYMVSEYPYMFRVPCFIDANAAQEAIDRINAYVEANQ